MKKTSYILFVCLCVATAFARDESSANGLGARPEVAPLASAQVELSPPFSTSPAMKGDTDLIAAFIFVATPPASCADSIANCKNPVKYLGADAGCACFACEYGKATQHNVCTNVKADKEALLKRSTPAHSSAKQ